jgi:hypothetical protein
VSDCDRCQGEGLVITYRGQPLWLGPTLGRQRIEEIARMPRIAMFKACAEPKRAMRLLLDCKGNRLAFMPMTCPDCKGEA